MSEYPRQAYASEKGEGRRLLNSRSEIGLEMQTAASGIRIRNNLQMQSQREKEYANPYALNQFQ